MRALFPKWSDNQLIQSLRSDPRRPGRRLAQDAGSAAWCAGRARAEWLATGLWPDRRNWRTGDV